MTDEYAQRLDHDLMVLSVYAARRRAFLDWAMGLSPLPQLASASASNDDGAGEGYGEGEGDGQDESDADDASTSAHSAPCAVTAP